MKNNRPCRRGNIVEHRISSKLFFLLVAFYFSLLHPLFFFFNIYLFIFGCTGSLLLHAGFLQLWQVGPTLQLQCMCFSLWWLLLQSMGSRARGLSSCSTRLNCPMECGIFQIRDQTHVPLHQQVDSYPLHHQGSPIHHFFKSTTSPR